MKKEVRQFIEGSTKQGKPFRKALVSSIVAGFVRMHWDDAANDFSLNDGDSLDGAIAMFTWGYVAAIEDEDDTIVDVLGVIEAARNEARRVQLQGWRKSGKTPALVK